MPRDLINPPAIVRTIDAEWDEAELVKAARASVSADKWFVGSCASVWTARYAKGRGDKEFADLVGLSAKSAQQRRQVFERFGDCSDLESAFLSWSHYLEALTWDDADECLAWANENQASIREMIAWRRMSHGLPLTTPEGDEEPVESEGTTEGPFRTEAAVKDDGGDVDAQDGASPENESPVVEDDDKPYAPYRGGKSSPVTATVDEDDTITKAPGSQRPQRVDNAAREFVAACEKLEANVRSFMAVTARDESLRYALEAVLVTLLEEVRNQ